MWLVHLHVEKDTFSLQNGQSEVLRSFFRWSCHSNFAVTAKCMRTLDGRSPLTLIGFLPGHWRIRCVSTVRRLWTLFRNSKWVQTTEFSEHLVQANWPHTRWFIDNEKIDFCGWFFFFLLKKNKIIIIWNKVSSFFRFFALLFFLFCLSVSVSVSLVLLLL